MRVFVAGGTGAIGRPLVVRLLHEGHQVSVLTRSSRSSAVVRAAGGEPVMGDATSPDDLRTAVVEARPDVVVNQLTSLSQSAGPRAVREGFAATGHLRSVVGPRLVAAAADAGAKRVISQSIAFVYRPGRGVRSEDDPLYIDGPGEVTDLVQSVLDLEAATMTNGAVEGVVLRYGTFYGPGTYYAPGGAFAELVRRRRLPVPGKGRGQFGFVHVQDAVTATMAALDGPPGVYNVVAGVAAPTAEWVPYMARLMRAKPPRRLPEALVRLAAGRASTYLLCHQPPVSSARARDRLGWAPAYNDWHDGFRATFV